MIKIEMYRGLGLQMKYNSNNQWTLPFRRWSTQTNLNLNIYRGHSIGHTEYELKIINSSTNSSNIKDVRKHELNFKNLQISFWAYRNW